MNDFFLANNESLPYTFIDQNIQIKQVQVKDIDRFAQYASRFKKLESYSVETITPLIEPYILQVMGVCSMATTLEANDFAKHSEEHTLIAELILNIIHVNEAYFKKEKVHQGSGQKTKDVSWFQSFAYLTKFGGHRTDDIMNMSYGAFLKYLDEAQAIERQQIKSYAIATRVANNAKQSGWDKYLKQLDG